MIPGVYESKIKLCEYENYEVMRTVFYNCVLLEIIVTEVSSQLADVQVAM